MFMDDSFVVSESFDECLNNMVEVSKICEE